MQFGPPECSMSNHFRLYAVYYWYWVKTYYMSRDVCSAGHRDTYIILEALHAGAMCGCPTSIRAIIGLRVNKKCRRRDNENRDVTMSVLSGNMRVLVCSSIGGLGVNHTI